MLERVLPAVVMIAAGAYLLLALQYPLGAAARPGAGFYPVMVAVFACVVGFTATAQAFLAPRVARRAATADPEAPAQRRRVLTTTAALVGFCLVMPWIGYPLSAAAFVIATLRGLDSRWPVAAGIGVVSALASYYLFAVLLDVPLPRGPW